MVTHEHLGNIDDDHHFGTIGLDDFYMSAVMNRQKQLAHEFRRLMTEGQSFEGVNSYREEFYRKVIVSAETVNFCDFFHLCNVDSLV